MTAVPLVLGVDGGNTKTIALVSRLDGTIVGVARGGCSDMYAVGSLRRAVDVILDTCDRALEAAGARREDIGAGGFSLAGADWPEDHDELRAALTGAGLGARCVVVNDGLGALRGGSPHGTGVAVVCGTGLAVASRSAGGASWHGSFWLDSHGGWALGEAVVRAVRRAELGIDPPTSLTARVLTAYGQCGFEAVLHLLTRRAQMECLQINHLSLILLNEADAGDAVSRRILHEHGNDIAEFAVVAARKAGLGNEPFPLVLAGGVLRHPSHYLRDTIVHSVRSAFPHVQPMPARYEPAIGALLLGFDALDLELTDDRRVALEGTMPTPDTFHTHHHSGSDTSSL